MNEPLYPREAPPTGEPIRRQRRMKELPASVLRPRDKLLRFGVRGMNHAELLAVLLGSGTRGENVIKIAEDLVGKYGASGLPQLSLKEWASNHGVGRIKAGQMLATFELGRRLQAPPADEPRVSSPAEAYALVRDLRKARKEHLVALYVDSQNRLIARETVSVGSLNTTRTHPREVLQPAIINSALAFILAHNHPSGSLDPSRDDVEFTRTMSRAGELMGISLYDHLIVSPRGFVSLKEKGLL
ncbi:MAG: DNA repair protein RadC [Acidobacteria bacterium]|nr:DNA repair protein RadC [Acidobacteriota bacterium]